MIRKHFRRRRDWAVCSRCSGVFQKQLFLYTEEGICWRCHQETEEEREVTDWVRSNLGEAKKVLKKQLADRKKMETSWRERL